MKKTIWLLVAAAWCLLLGFVTFHELWVYQLSRWAVCGVAVWGAIRFPGVARVLLCAVAIVFNPIAPIHFGRSAWQVVDFLGCVVFVAAVCVEKLNGKRGEA